MGKVGVIGGTGMYDADFLDSAKEISMPTPYGKTSQPVVSGKIGSVDVIIIPRHGKGHTLSPAQINYRANIWAMKELNVTRILAPCAVGSLKETIKPGDLVFIDQLIDRTTKRLSTFYDKGKVCHVSMAEPFCHELRKLLTSSAKKLGLPYHDNGTNVVIEGPRFATRAESELYRSWNADTINMTALPECILAREAEICYAAIAQVTDYDCWRDSIVTVDEIVKTLKANVEKTKKLLADVIPCIPDERDCDCKNALTGAFI
jgi:5'-methylthioadenosine phosphorylase